MRYPLEFKYLSYKLNQKGVGTHVIAKTIGCSSKTVWNWVVAFRGGKKLTRKGWARRRGDLLSQRWFREGKIKFTVRAIGECFQRLVRWMFFRDYQGGWLDWDAILAGEEPP